MKIINLTFYIGLGIITAIHCQTANQEECGILDENLLNNNKLSTVLHEHPWIALLQYKRRNGRNKELQIKCQGVLVSKRIVITNNHCLSPSNYELENVILGDWDASTSRDCDFSNNCAFNNSEAYKVDEIILNPAYKSETQTGNIAMIRLDRDVQYTEYIKPICLPPANGAYTSNDFIAKHLYASGFEFARNTSVYEKTKTKVQVVSPSYCDKFNTIPLNTDEHICGIILDQEYRSGVGLMDVKVENNIPKYFYLVGLVSYATNNEVNTPNGISLIFKWLPWIRNNLD